LFTIYGSLTLLNLPSVAVITAILSAFVGFVAALVEEKRSANIKEKENHPFVLYRKTLGLG